MDKMEQKYENRPAVKAESNTEKKAGADKVALIAVFLGFIFVFALLILFLPKHEGELSPNERRILAAAPDASFSNILSGNFSKQTDTWLQDHFPGRTFFVSLYAYLNRFTGRNAVEKISLGAGSRLFTYPIEADDEVLQTNIGKVSGFAANNSLESKSFVIPTSGYMLEDALPGLHLEYHDGELIEAFSNGVAPGTESISAERVFRAYGDVSQLYYRTDHHLTMKGSYVSYRALAEALGLEPLDESAFKKTSYEFFGTSYGQSGLFLTPADTLEVWEAPYFDALAVTTIDGRTETPHEGPIDKSCLEEGVVDKYAAYLYSNHGITLIENPDAPEGTLMVMKDSYGNAIVPFLAAHYSRIVMIDVRSLYYSPVMPTPSELCQQYGVHDFLIIAGLDTVAEGTLDWLR